MGLHHIAAAHLTVEKYLRRQEWTICLVTHKRILKLQEDALMNMMYGLDEDLQKRESADGSMEYPAVSCRAIKDCHPEKTDG